MPYGLAALPMVSLVSLAALELNQMPLPRTAPDQAQLASKRKAIVQKLPGNTYGQKQAQQGS